MLEFPSQDINSLALSCGFFLGIQRWKGWLGSQRRKGNGENLSIEMINVNASSSPHPPLSVDWWWTDGQASILKTTNQACPQPFQVLFRRQSQYLLLFSQGFPGFPGMLGQKVSNLEVVKIDLSKNIRSSKHNKKSSASLSIRQGW